MFEQRMLLLVATAGVTGIATGFRGSSFILLGARFQSRLRKALFDKLLSFEMAFFDANKTGEVTSRLSADCQKVCGFVKSRSIVGCC